MAVKGSSRDFGVCVLRAKIVVVARVGGWEISAVEVVG
jgi:hypothetical protein